MILMNMRNIMRIEITKDDTIDTLYRKLPDGFFLRKQLKSTFDSLLKKDENGFFILPEISKAIEDAYNRGLETKQIKLSECKITHES